MFFSVYFVCIFSVLCDFAHQNELVNTLRRGHETDASETENDDDEMNPETNAEMDIYHEEH